MGLEDNNLETNEDLQRAIAELRGTDNAEPEQPAEEDNGTVDDNADSALGTPQDEAGESAGEGSSEGSQEAPVEGNIETAEEVVKDASELLSELGKELGVPDEAHQPDEIEQLQAQLSVATNQLHNVDILEGLPQTGVFAPDNKSIYQMEPAELNNYLIKLRDAGQEYEAGQVQMAYMKAVQNVNAYVERQNLIASEKQRLQELIDTKQWQQVRTNYLTKLPELEKHIPTVAQRIDLKAQTDAVFANLLTTQDGKMKAVLLAIRELGLDKELSKKEPKPQPSLPSAPEARAGSKKVSNVPPQTLTRADLAKMSQAEYERREAEIDAMMAKGLIR